VLTDKKQYVNRQVNVATAHFRELFRPARLLIGAGTRTMVTRCICYNHTFRELKRIARRTGAESIEQLQEHVRFGRNCRRCHPYVRRMLLTGRTEFEVIPELSDDAGSL
jgi:bacterioferritin-associated ferredoxin